MNRPTTSNSSARVIDTSSDENFVRTQGLNYKFNRSREPWDDGKFFRWKKIIIRASHLFLVLFISGNLLLQQTSLHDALIERQLFYLFSYVLLTYLALVFYFITCLKNPGYVERGDFVSTTHSSDLPTIKLRYCTICELEQPIRSRHCEECRRCINKFDHHCPWLETCIGERNHRYFWLFLATMNALIIWSIAIAYEAIIHYQKWPEWLGKNLLLLFDLQVLVISFLVSISLFLIHTYFMLTNTTTWERFSRKNITYLRIIKNDSYNPFQLGYLRNVYVFLCSPRTTKWDNVYATFVKNKLRPDQLVREGGVVTSDGRSSENEMSSDNEVEIKLENLRSGNIRIK